MTNVMRDIFCSSSFCDTKLLISIFLERALRKKGLHNYTISNSPLMSSMRALTVIRLRSKNVRVLCLIRGRETIVLQKSTGPWADTDIDKDQEE